MGYTFTWTDMEKICRKPGMEKQGKSSVWTGVGPDGKIRTTTIHSKHTGNVGPGLPNEILRIAVKHGSAE
jgi:hypothetical protein